jgi:hypothetical protein
MTLDLAHDEAQVVEGLGSTFAETAEGAILFDDYTRYPETWLAELAPEGTRRDIWLCNDWAVAHDITVWGCDPNETVWLEDTDTVLWSMWASDTVLELDRSDGAVLAQWGSADGSWTFDPPEALFDMQHYPHLTDEGTLMVSTHGLPLHSHYIREYSIDRDTETLAELWNYGGDLAEYPRYGGEAYRLVGGHTFVNFGTESVLREITTDGERVWEVRWDQDYLIGHVSPIEDLYAVNRGPDTAGTGDR